MKHNVQSVPHTTQLPHTFAMASYTTLIPAPFLLMRQPKMDALPVSFLNCGKTIYGGHVKKDRGQRSRLAVQQWS